MAHITFYRKYRSKSFTEMVGQEHIINTLSNAIENDRLTHAYVFSGPRGTGKTSTARILAKSLNCREGKGVEPCLKCDLCTKITKGHSVDVIEIDAASNTGVDNIRDLTDQVNFTPVECRYKIYIIDEAHMLSTGAFNALLKTLEESPPNTIFILATTESHKIPVTIHSRCQQHHFRKLTNQEIISQLQHIVEEEKIKITKSGLSTIAKNSSGCMRDAISLLDQIYSFKGESIKDEDIQLILGATNFEGLCKLFDTLLSANYELVLQQLTSFFDSGVNAYQLLADLTAILKQMLYIKCGVIDPLELEESRIKELKKRCDMLQFEQIQYMLEVYAKCESECRLFPNADLLIEVRSLALIRHFKSEQQNNYVTETSQKSKENYIKVDEPKIISASKTTVSKSVPSSVNMSTNAKELNAKVLSTAESSLVSNVSKPKEAISQSKLNPNQIWTKCLEAIKTKNRGIYTIFSGSHFLGTTQQTVQVKLKQNFKFFQEKLKEEATQRLLSDVFQSIFNQKLTLEVVEGVAPNTKDDEVNSEVIPKNEPQQEPIQHVETKKINEVIDLFEGRLL